VSTGDSASWQAVTLVNVDRTSKRRLRTPTLRVYEGRRRWAQGNLKSGPTAWNNTLRTVPTEICERLDSKTQSGLGILLSPDRYGARFAFTNHSPLTHFPTSFRLHEVA
jgi:hypothetical protein